MAEKYLLKFAHPEGHSMWRGPCGLTTRLKSATRHNSIEKASDVADEILDDGGLGLYPVRESMAMEG